MRLRFAFSAVACVVVGLALAPVANSAIILVGGEADQGQRLGESDLYRFTIAAMGTDGEIINTISGINVSGNVHQVFGLFDAETPGADQASGPAWNAAWTPYDTHVLIPASQRVGTVGAPLTETNDGNTAGTLGLPNTALGAPPKSGFGGLSSVDGSDSFALLPTAAGTNVAFLQLVTTLGTAMLDVRIDAQKDGTGVFQTFENYMVGGGGVDPENLAPIIPGGVVPHHVPAQVLEFDFSVGTTDDGPLSELVWAYVGSEKNGGALAPANAPQFDVNTGQFSWLPHLSDLMGADTAEWKFTVQATDMNGQGLTGTGMLTVTLNIPEPSSIALVGLAMVGLVGFAGRRRS